VPFRGQHQATICVFVIHRCRLPALVDKLYHNPNYILRSIDHKFKVTKFKRRGKARLETEIAKCRGLHRCGFQNNLDCDKNRSTPNSFAELSFVSPVLWIDWIVVTELLWKRVPLLGWLGLGFTVPLWGVCLWLVIGYAALGYETEQYQVLNVPDQCGYLGIPWQTDPRRKVFVTTHICLFAFSSAALFIGIYVYVRRRPRPGWDAYRADFGEQQYWKQRRKSFVRSVGIILAMAICGVCCSGALYAGILNTYEYVQREGCYGSYVSSRWGYLESDIVNVYIKISEFFGILPVV